MKKFFFLFFIFSTFALVSMQAFAYPGGLLDGRAVSRATTLFDAYSTTSQATDGATTTGVTMNRRDMGADYYYYKFPTAATITDFRFYSNQIAAATYVYVTMYDAVGNQLYRQLVANGNTTNLTNGTKYSITPVSNVKYISIENTYNTAIMTIYEMDAYGTAYSYQESSSVDMTQTNQKLDDILSYQGGYGTYILVAISLVAGLLAASISARGLTHG